MASQDAFLASPASFQFQGQQIVQFVLGIRHRFLGVRQIAPAPATAAPRCAQRACAMQASLGPMEEIAAHAPRTLLNLRTDLLHAATVAALSCIHLLPVPLKVRATGCALWDIPRMPAKMCVLAAPQAPSKISLGFLPAQSVKLASTRMRRVKSPNRLVMTVHPTRTLAAAATCSPIARATQVTRVTMGRNAASAWLGPGNQSTALLRV